MSGKYLRNMRRALATLFLTYLATSAFARDRVTSRLLASAWPQRNISPVTETGRGIAIVFSPDLSVEGNCSFYAALGFTCFDGADWGVLLDAITAHNLDPEAIPIRTVILETHGTNGNGLKLQRGYDEYDERSYISVGALEERLAEAGARYVIISACNSGRLLRKEIVEALDAENGDPLFLPATCGIIDASATRKRKSGVTIVAPAKSHIESTLVARTDELPRAVQDELLAAAIRKGLLLPDEFAISDMLMQILADDATLRLAVAKPVEKLSDTRSDQQFSERLFVRFMKALESRVSGQ